MDEVLRTVIFIETGGRVLVTRALVEGIQSWCLVSLVSQFGKKTNSGDGWGNQCVANGWT